MRKKKKNKELLKKTVDVIKKASEAERKKSEEKKLKKKNKPKGMKARRLGMITFWFLFSFMFLVTMVNIFSAEGDTNQEVQVEKNKLFDNEGLEFAKEFVYQYFTWTTDKFGRERRAYNLERYFMDGLDDLGGIIYNNEWASSTDKRDITLVDVQEISDSQARYIFKVKFTLKSKTDAKDTPKPDDNLSFEETLKEERKMKVVNGYNVKVNEKYISVPVYYNQEKDRFAIFDLPSFTYVKEGKLDDQIENNLANLDMLSDTYVESNVIAFLNTFFESYSKDGRDKLNYILEDERHQDGLNGSMEFVEIKDAKIYNADENNNKFIADTQVILRDPSTKFEFTNKYLLVIKRVDQRYVVESLNDEKAVNEIVDKYLAEIESETTNALTEEPEQEVEQDFNYQEEMEQDPDSELEEEAIEEESAE